MEENLVKEMYWQNCMFKKKQANKHFVNDTFSSI